jgi:hypothetical protein
MMPNDEDEQARLGDLPLSNLSGIGNSNILDLQHHLFRMTMDDKLFLAPLSNPQNVMDIATGTGIWAIEFGNNVYSLLQLGQLG